MAGKDHFRSSYGSYSTQQRELERSRARRDAADAAEAAAEAEAAEQTSTDVATPEAAADVTPGGSDADQPATPPKA